jgi:hypothetical protein
MRSGNPAGHEQIVREGAKNDLIKLPFTQILAALPTGPAFAARGGGGRDHCIALAHVRAAADGDDIASALMTERTERHFGMPAPVGFQISSAGEGCAYFQQDLPGTRRRNRTGHELYVAGFTEDRLTHLRRRRKIPERRRESGG